MTVAPPFAYWLMLPSSYTFGMVKLADWPSPWLANCRLRLWIAVVSVISTSIVGWVGCVP